MSMVETSHLQAAYPSLRRALIQALVIDPELAVKASTTGRPVTDITTGAAVWPRLLLLTSTSARKVAL